VIIVSFELMNWTEQHGHFPFMKRKVGLEDGVSQGCGALEEARLEENIAGHDMKGMNTEVYDGRGS
jgi:hypothetical protein